MKAMFLMFFMLTLILSGPAFSQAASATWALTSAQTAAISGNVNASNQALTNMQVSYSSSVQRSSPTGTAGTWVAETGENSTRYMEFSLQPTSGNSLNIASIALNLYTNSGSNMKANVYYSADPTFTSSTQIGSTISLSTTVPGSPNITASPNLDITSAETFYLRIYPWNTGATTGKYVITNNVVISGNTSLPVELTSFKVLLNGKTVELQWNTATEVNNAGFEIQRKTAAGDWSKIGYVEGNGTSNAPHSYSYVDKISQPLSFQYRLKQIDRNGAFEYSPVVEAINSLTAADYQLSQNYPNPFNPSTTFSFAVQNTEMVSVKVFNIVGQEVATLFNRQAEANNLYTVRFDAATLPSGIYFYTLHSASRHEMKKMMLLK